MDSDRKISDDVLEEMKNFLQNEQYIGQLAHPDDLFFLTDDSWLKDTAVIDMVSNKQGGWDVSLIFVHYKNPLQFIIRHITRCFSRQKAEATAFYIRKEAAKDRRGTLSVSINDLDICDN